METTDAKADSSPASVEDTFYKDLPGAKTDSPTEDVKKIESSATSTEETTVGTVQTEAATEPADKELEPGDSKEKSPRTSWSEMRQARYRAEAERDLLREQLAERNKAASSTVTPPAEKPALDPAKPKSENFETYDDFLDARDLYNRKQWESEQAEKQKQTAEAEARTTEEKETAKRLENWNKREAIVTAKHGGYKAAFDSFLIVAKSNPALAKAVFRSEIGPDLANHLGVTPAELQKLGALDGEDLWKEIGKLEDKLTAKGSDTPTQTKAPRPLGDVGGNAGAIAKELTLEESFYGKN